MASKGSKTGKEQTGDAPAEKTPTDKIPASDKSASKSPKRSTGENH